MAGHDGDSAIVRFGAASGRGGLRTRVWPALALLGPILASVAIWFESPRRFEATATLVIESPAGFAAAGRTGERLATALLTSRDVGRQAALRIDTARLFPELDGKSGGSRDRLLDLVSEKIADGLSVQTSGDRETMRLSLRDRDPAVVRATLPAIVDAYRSAEPEPADEIEALSAARERAAASLDQARRELTRFGQDHQVFALPSQLPVLIEEESRLRMAALQADQNSAGSDAAAATLRQAVDRQQNAASMSGTSNAAPQAPAALRRKLLSLLQHRAELRTLYRDDFPDVKALDGEIAAVRGAIAAARSRSGPPTPAMAADPVSDSLRGDLSAEETRGAGERARRDLLLRQAEEVRARLVELATLKLDYGRLERAVTGAAARLDQAERALDLACSGTAPGRSTPTLRLVQLTGPDAGRMIDLGTALVTGIGAGIAGLGAVLFGRRRIQAPVALLPAPDRQLSLPAPPGMWEGSAQQIDTARLQPNAVRGDRPRSGEPA